MEQIRTMAQLMAAAKQGEKKIVSVAVPEDDEVMEAVEAARKEGIISAILVGNGEKIKTVADKLGIDLSNYEVVDERGGNTAAALRAVEIVSSGNADIFMKGMLHSADYLRAVLNKEKGLRTGRVLSHAYIHEIEGYDRLFFVTDGVVNLYPDLKTKIDIVNNCADICHAFGLECPKVAILGAVEVVNVAMPPTLDAAALAQMSNRKQFKGCIVDGPLALDNAVSEESAHHKGIVSPVAGKADVLFVPNIETGNILAKSMVYFARNKTAALVLGAKAPVILTSRADSAETKMYSIASACLVAQHKA